MVAIPDEHSVCEVKLSKGRTVYEGKRLSLSEMQRMGRREWRKRFACPTFFITGKDKSKLSYFWDHVFLRAKSGTNLGGVTSIRTPASPFSTRRWRSCTALDFGNKVKVSRRRQLPRGGTTRFSALLASGSDPHSAHGANRSASGVTWADGSTSPSRTGFPPACRRHRARQWPWRSGRARRGD